MPQDPDVSDAAAKTYVSDLVVAHLRRLAVKYAFICPGASFRGVHDSLANTGEEGPTIITTLHEEIAVSMAHAYAKATGDVGVVILHDLVGIMHGSMAVYNAWCDAVPLLILGGGGPADGSRRRSIDWVHSATAQGALIRDFVKWDDEPIGVRSTLESISTGFLLAGAAPQGPVYVTLDMALMEEECPATPEPMHPAPVAPVPEIVPPDDVVSATAARLLRADRPLVVAGNLGYRAANSEMLSAVVSELAACYFDSVNATALPSDHALNFNGCDAFIDSYGPDAVLAIDVEDLAGLRSRFGDDAEVVDVSMRSLRMRPWLNAPHGLADSTLHLTASAGAFLRALGAAIESVKTDLDDPARKRIDERRRALSESRRGLIANRTHEIAARLNDGTLSIDLVLDQLWRLVKDEPWLLALRNTRSWPEGIWSFGAAGQWLGHSAGGGVGYGPGAFAGAALAARASGKLCVGIIGDGDLLMAPGALWTMSHYKLPGLLVVNNNVSFGNDVTHQLAVARERGRSLTKATTGLMIEDPCVDFPQLARSFGAWSTEPVTDTAQVRPALEQGLKAVRAGRLAVIDVRV